MRNEPMYIVCKDQGKQSSDHKHAGDKKYLLLLIREPLTTADPFNEECEQVPAVQHGNWQKIKDSETDGKLSCNKEYSGHSILYSKASHAVHHYYSAGRFLQLLNLVMLEHAAHGCQDVTS